MSLTLAEVEHVSRLARMHLSPEELEHMRAQLSSILEYMEMLREVNVEGVTPTAQVTGLSSIMRPDEVEPSLPREDVLRNAPAHREGMFQVKAVFEE
jgi:aspartyl-tRNA(Asn)/glutamyl-tRNA(Gln) amidotransferase subunit C